jgi:hypothetical protein
LPFGFVLRDEEKRHEWVHCSLKLVVSNGPSGLEAPSPSGFAGSKVLGPNHRGSSDFRCGGSAGLETPTTSRGDGVASPSGFEMSTALWRAASKHFEAIETKDLRIRGIGRFIVRRCESPLSWRCREPVPTTFGSAVSEAHELERLTVLRLRCLRSRRLEVPKVFGSEVSKVCGVDEANARGWKRRELEIPGFWEARGVEGLGPRRSELWV